MKFPREDLEKKVVEIAKKLREKRDISGIQLEKWRTGIAQDFEHMLHKIDAGKNKIRDAIAQQRSLQRFRESIVKTLFPLRLRLLLGAPIIYGMIFPALLLDFSLALYQGIFFRLIGIPRVRRSDHFCFDRRYLSYLNGIEKFNCLYCSYFNGLMSFSREIAGRTERYFCPIKNARRRFDAHTHYGNFFEYLDGEQYRREHKTLRDFNDCQ